MIIDISQHNGNIDFGSLENIEEVIIRASLGYGNFDKNLNVNANGVTNVGIPVSYYHFAYPSGTDGVAQDAIKEATYFCDTISKLPNPKRLAIDLEEFGQNKDTELSPDDYAMWLQTFLDTVETKTGIRCMIYSYGDYLNRHLPKNHKFGVYDLWIANYTKKDKPKLPSGWVEHALWQYSQEGVVSGINGKTDLNR